MTRDDGDKENNIEGARSYANILDTARPSSFVPLLPLPPMMVFDVIHRMFWRILGNPQHITKLPRASQLGHTVFKITPLSSQSHHYIHQKFPECRNPRTPEVSIVMSQFPEPLFAVYINLSTFAL